MNRLGLAFLGALLLWSGAVRAASPERVNSPGGITAWLMPDPTSPKIAVALAFRGGRAADPWDGIGLSDLALETLMQGVGDLDRRALLGRMADLTASVWVSAGVHWLSFDFTIVKERQRESIDLLHQMLAVPHPTDERIERASFNVMGDINGAVRDPAQLATLALRRAIAPDNPVLRAWLPIMAAVDHPSRARLEEWYRTRFAKDEVLIGVGGSITVAELGPMLDRLFAGMPDHGTARAVPELEPAIAGNPLVLVPRSEGETSIAALALGPIIGDPDYVAFAALNEVFGADVLNSRLGTQLRERRGLTYGISSELERNQLIVSGTVAHKDAAQAIATLREVWPEIGRDGITAAELATAKRRLRENFAPTRPANSLDAAEQMLFFQERGLDEHWNSAILSAIDALTADDVKRVAKRVLGPAPLAISLVGQPVGITPTCTIANPLIDRCK